MQAGKHTAIFEQGIFMKHQYFQIITHILSPSGDVGSLKKAFKGDGSTTISRTTEPEKQADFVIILFFFFFYFCFKV